MEKWLGGLTYLLISLKNGNDVAHQCRIDSIYKTYSLKSIVNTLSILYLYLEFWLVEI